MNFAVVSPKNPRLWIFAGQQEGRHGYAEHPNNSLGRRKAQILLPYSGGYIQQQCCFFSLQHNKQHCFAFERVLTSLAQRTALFCFWACPYKSSTGHAHARWWACWRSCSQLAKVTHTQSKYLLAYELSWVHLAYNIYLHQWIPL
jgi:hypothetical protein